VRERDPASVEVAVVQLEAGKQPSARRGEYDGRPFEIATSLLDTAVEFDAVIPAIVRTRLLTEAIFDVCTPATITRKALLAALGRRENAYLSASMQRYMIATFMSVKFGDHLRPIHSNNVKIQFFPRWPKRIGQLRLVGVHDRPTEHGSSQHSSVLVTLSARSTHEALEQALIEVDYIRGLWNFELTRYTISRHAMPARPIGEIALGPLHAVHEVGGMLASDSFGYQPQFTPPSGNDAQKWQRVINEVPRIRLGVRRSAYPAVLKDVFIRYARALDGTDFDASFLKLWSLLETLTVTKAARYDQTIKRALFTFKETEPNRALLEHLRDFRNARIHAGVTSADVEKFAWQLKRVVDVLILFHVAWGRRFKALDQVGEFLDLPRDPEALESRITLFKNALRYRGG
jgi:hypothetical protein